VGANQLTPAQARSATAALSSAGHLNPDSTVDVLRAELAYTEGHQPEAVRILVSVVHREPDNVAAWAQLAAATARGPLFQLAIRNVARLDPKIR
jgi:predicted Zn-dependent protease